MARVGDDKVVRPATIAVLSAFRGQLVVRKDYRDVPLAVIGAFRQAQLEGLLATNSLAAILARNACESIGREIVRHQQPTLSPANDSLLYGND
jgi:hypothetical protein